MNKFQIIKDAQAKKRTQVVFEIPLGDNETTQVALRSVDLLAISEAIEMQKSKLLARYTSEGLDKIAPNKGEWDAYIKGRKEKFVEDGKSPEEIKKALKEEEEGKPTSEADRLAKKFAFIFAAREVIPALLRDPETDAFICTDEQQRKEFVSLFKEDSNLMTLIASKYGELAEMGNKLEEIVKN